MSGRAGGRRRPPWRPCVRPATRAGAPREPRGTRSARARGGRARGSPRPASTGRGRSGAARRAAGRQTGCARVGRRRARCQAVDKGGSRGRAQSARGSGPARRSACPPSRQTHPGAPSGVEHVDVGANERVADELDRRHAAESLPRQRRRPEDVERGESEREHDLATLEPVRGPEADHLARPRRARPGRARSRAPGRSRSSRPRAAPEASRPHRRARDSSMARTACQDSPMEHRLVVEPARLEAATAARSLRSGAIGGGGSANASSSRTSASTAGLAAVSPSSTVRSST